MKSLKLYPWRSERSKVRELAAGVRRGVRGRMNGLFARGCGADLFSLCRVGRAEISAGTRRARFLYALAPVELRRPIPASRAGRAEEFFF